MSVTAIKLTPHEVFERTQAYKIRSKKVEFLAAQGDFVIKSILQGNFSNAVAFDLPAGAPPFKRDAAPVGYATGAMKGRIRQLVHLLKGSKLPKPKKERMFVQILESIHPKDADILIAMKDRKLTELYPTITLDVVKEAFPKLALS